jgi:hypothetical protein
MSDPDPKTTLREFKEYVARSYVLPGTIAGRIFSVSQSTKANRFCWCLGLGTDYAN